ncbi:hypothetical protein MSAN_01891400 [Mycena sanguinolenta]|uniref:Uncharacterized protein n=1 Tax=Mycena sanguinolenta TaxID=230812 RepID=A0A8H6XQ89_9AGAR|nr:hypothetical protein MSAN_01891400 [Mycena sanguinolenta]
MSLALDSRSWSLELITPAPSHQVILGLTIPGVGLTTGLLSLYAYAAWKPVSRRYLDRVSFRLLTYALVAHLCFGISFTVGALTSHPGRQCALLPFFNNEQLSVLFSAGMFFSIGVNLPLVLAFNINGQKMEKYYVGGTTLIALVSNLVPYVSGNLGWDDDNRACWYRTKDPSAKLHWLVATQSVWVLLASLGEATAFIIIIRYLVVYRLVTEDTPPSFASTMPHRPGPTILRLRNIILRIGLYPMVSCILSISTTIIEITLLQPRQTNVTASQQNWRLDLADATIYAGRPLIYGLLAATDPSFIRALRALRYPENESEALSQIRTPGVEMSTIIHWPQDEISINEQNKDKDNTLEFSLGAQRRVEETSTISTPDVNPEIGKMQSLVDGNGMGVPIDVMYHI